MDIACEWGGKSDGSFNYKKEATDEIKQSRKWKETPDGVRTYDEWKS